MKHLNLFNRIKIDKTYFENIITFDRLNAKSY